MVQFIIKNSVKILNSKLKISLFIFAFFLVASHDANAGVIVHAPVYLGLNNGLVGYWTFDGSNIGLAGTQAKDTSGNNNHGTLTGNGGPVVVAGKIGQALRFIGDADLVNIGNPSTLQITGSLTAVAWIKLNGYQPGGVDDRIIMKGAQSPTFSWLLKGTEDTGPETIAFGFSSDGTITCGTCGQRYGTTVLSKGVWYHVAGVYNATAQTVHVYVNGVLDDGSITNPAPSSLFNTSDSLSIGNEPGGTTSSNGLIDDVRIYNRALSAREIERLYLIGLGSKQNRSIGTDGGDALFKGLVGCWNFDGAYTNVPDCSGNNNPGTLDAGPTKVQGKIGQALSFNGVSGGVTINAGMWGTGAAVVSAWIYPTLDTVGIIFDNGNSPQAVLYIGSGKNGRMCFSNDGQTTEHCSSDFSITFNAWQFVTAVRSSSNQITLYINGVQSGSANQAAGTPSVGKVTSYIGMISDGTQVFNGRIDEVRAYNRALSSGEIKRLYDQSQTKFNSSGVNAISGQTVLLASGLVGHWTFDGPQISGTRAKDTSGNNNHEGIIGTVDKAQGKIGQAFGFADTDGSNYLRADPPLPGLNNLPAVSVSVWLKIGNKDNYGEIVNKLAAGLGWFLVTDNTRQLAFSANFAVGAATKYSISGVLPKYAWVHAVSTWDGSGNSSGIHIYINGQETSYSSTAEGSGGRADDSNVALKSGNQFIGSMDDIRIYNRVLSAGEVLKLYNMGH